MPKTLFVYVMTNRPRGTLYIGVTSDLVRRVHEHKTGAADGFTKRYSVTRLVWYELAETMDSAILREKQIKKWNRAWKVRLIEASNPDWLDLWPGIAGSTH